jgi:hypothetical protein
MPVSIRCARWDASAIHAGFMRVRPVAFLLMHARAEAAIVALYRLPYMIDCCSVQFIQ